MTETWLPPLLNHAWMIVVVCTLLQGRYTFGILFDGFIEFIWFPSIIRLPTCACVSTAPVIEDTHLLCESVYVVNFVVTRVTTFDP